MKIDGNNIGSAAPAGAQESASIESARKAARLGYRGADSTDSTSAQPGGDQVELSGLGQILSRLAKEDSGREARIEQLASAYEQGTLEPDARVTAQKLVDDAFHNE